MPEEEATVQTEKLDKRRKKKEPRDPNAPKKPLTAFFYFMKIRREQMGTQKGTVASEVTQTIGKEWAALSDAQKEGYKAAALKVRNEWH